MKKVALFDFDETLVKENSLSYLFRYLLGTKPLFLYLFPILADRRFYTGQHKAAIKFCLYHRSLAGRRLSEVYDAGKDTAKRLTLLTEVTDKLTQLDKEGVEVWIITASPQAFIEGVVDELQWPVHRVVGTELKSNKGILTGEIGNECQINEKVYRFNAIVEQEGLELDVQEAYGNLPVDKPMLELASDRFYVEHGKLNPYLK